jgi:hypothetical protein
VAFTDQASGGRAKKFRRFVSVAGSAEMIYQLTGSNMSSPQTADLNAKARAPTIDKWVNITAIEAGAWIAFMTWLDGTGWPIVGGGLAWAGMWAKYKYAISSGLENNAPPTENYSNFGAPHGGRRRGAAV